ncbi:FKBP-type peptidyl-prolyl cis-trans isomerase [Lewinella cohaerens]|uniref:FKBP-type peptidyl-prolyl cis-trans isomerase n=1 Tax=Lewinella cohaerens TaxID=70995 RepID=UPI0003A5924B|nr:FKBP-type peptidyl-prolyl cis-trans isomerase [Lewinella cohaerens]
MKRIMILLLMVGLLVSCGQPPPAAEQEPPPVLVNEDDLLLRLSAYLSTDTSRVAREQNEIVDYAIENLLDVQVSNSGLFYGVRQEGGGEAISWGDYLKVHYKGYLLDGTVFADSREQDRPLSFYVGNMIPAWNEGLTYIKVGGKLLLLVPSHLGYGADGLKTSKGRVIVPPYQILAFEVEVLEKG